MSHLIEYLEQLVEERDSDAAIVCAERLILSRENSPADLARIHCALLISRYRTHQYYAASVSGQVALKLARELEEWDTYGYCCFYLGLTQESLKDLQLSISMLLEFFYRYPFYVRAAKLEPWVWLNLGIISTVNDDPSGAIGYLLKAQNAAKVRGEAYLRHASRHALIEAYLLMGDLQSIPRLMAMSLHFLRHHPDKSLVMDSWLWHMLLRANYALRRNRVDRAMSISNMALKRSEKQSYQQFHFHMLLAGLSMKKGLINKAFGHSLAARMCAIKESRHDFESQAMDLIYQLTSGTGLDSIMISSEFMVDESHWSLFTGASAQ